MTNYTTKDFSQIHPPEDKPVHVGWYVADTLKYYISRYHSLNERITYQEMWWWDGTFWWTSMGDKNGQKAINQDRYWFGLREKQL